MSKCYLSKKELLLRREILLRFGEDGKFRLPWNPPWHGKNDGLFKVCPQCGLSSYIPFQDLPGTCGRPTCGYEFQEVRRGKRT